MKKKLMETTREALYSVLPITIIVFALSVVISPMPVGTLGLFLFGAVLLVIGMGLFTMGADMALLTMGGDIGIKMTATKNLILIGLISFAMGTIVTIAEPDLLVLAALVHDVPSMALILTVGLGVGFSLMIAILRIVFSIKLSKLLIGFYTLAFILSFFVPNTFIGVAFDSGGVTTGPITVPFILAMGLGLASIRGDRNSLDDSFGLVSISSIGPIIAVLVLGIFFKPESASYVMPDIPMLATSRDVTVEFVREIPGYFKEVATSIWPILAVLALFQLITRRYNTRQLLRIIIGLIYTFAGLVVFMTGVNVGFIPVGQFIGSDIAHSSMNWLLVPIGALIGYFIVSAEPAVHVLIKQIEEVSSGAIPGVAVQKYLSIGVSVSLVLSMFRVLLDIPVYWFLVPGYAIAMILTFFVPQIFVGIAFDSGGIASGSMTLSFLLPFAIGACVDPSKIMTDAFGLVAMVAMTPPIAIQLMGVVYKKHMDTVKSEAQPSVVDDDEILEFCEDGYIDFDLRR